MKTAYQCTVCGLLTTGRLPRGAYVPGDGTAMYPRRHRGCPGALLLADWVDVPDEAKIYGEAGHR